MLDAATTFLSVAGPQTAPQLGGRSQQELYLSLGVLGFGILMAGLETVIIAKAQRGWDGAAVRVMGLTLVIVAGLFLITAGYSQDQIAPMIGLLGTVAGYLLGKGEGVGSKSGE